MGLEQVELVMDVEEHFGIEVPDESVERVKTVADFAAVVILLLPNPPCATRKAFYEFRRLLVEQIGVDRRSVRPGTRLNEIIVKKRKRAWNAMRSKDSRLPVLVATAEADRFAIGLSIVTMIMAVASLMWVWNRFDGVVFGLLICVLVVCAGCVVCWFNRIFASEYPAGIVTVGDVVRDMVPLDAGREGSGERLIAQQKVLEDVRRLTAEVAGLPLEKVRPETDFVKDLGFG